MAAAQLRAPPQMRRVRASCGLHLFGSSLPLLFFSFAQTKLPNYVALEFPALALHYGALLRRRRAAGRDAFGRCLRGDRTRYDRSARLRDRGLHAQQSAHERSGERRSPAACNGRRNLRGFALDGTCS